MKNTSNTSTPPAQKTLFIAIIIAVSFLVYFNTLFNGLISDDKSFILKNPWIKDIRFIPTIFLSADWGFLFGPEARGLNPYYRPMYHVFFMTGYHLFGTEPWGYHLINNIVHSVNSVLVFLICSFLVVELSWLKDRSSKAKPTVPLVAALVFALHPINTESVAWVAAISELSYAFFFLLTFYLYISSYGNRSKRRFLSVGTFMLAVLSKEPALFLPLAMLLYDYVVGKEPVRPVVPWVRRYLPYAVVVIIYFGLRTYALRGLSTMDISAPAPPGQTLLNLLALYGSYIKKLILPVPLIFFEFMEPVKSAAQPVVIFSVITLVLTVILAWRLMRSNRTALFCLLWIFVPLVPVFIVSALQGLPLVSERYLYIPSVGFAVLLSMGFARMGELKTFRTRSMTAVLKCLVIVLLSVFSYAVVSRSFTWRDEFTLWSDTAEKNPRNKFAHNNLGIFLAKKGRTDEAFKEIQKALEIDPNHISARINLGVILAQMGRLDEAIVEFQRVLANEPENMEVRNNLEKALRLKGQ